MSHVRHRTTSPACAHRFPRDPATARPARRATAAFATVAIRCPGCWLAPVTAPGPISARPLTARTQPTGTNGSSQPIHQSMHSAQNVPTSVARGWISNGTVSSRHPRYPAH
jgi:hypothetical protein